MIIIKTNTKHKTQPIEWFYSRNPSNEPAIVSQNPLNIEQLETVAEPHTVYLPYYFPTVQMMILHLNLFFETITKLESSTI